MHLQPVVKRIFAVCSLVSMIILSACGSPPKREPYSGADLVGEIDPAMLVGNWKITVLNPIAEEGKAQVTTAYRGDGTWTSVAIPPPQQQQDLGPMKFEGIGTWQVNGDSMFAKTETINETSGNPYGGLMETVMSVFMSKMTGTVNAYELTQDRMILVNDESGQATLLERI